MRIFLYFIVLSTLVFSQSPYGFLKFNHSARGTALGGAAASIENDASLITYNPALIETVENNFVNVTFMKNVLDISSGNITYVHDGWDIGKIAFSANFNNWGDFDRTDDVGNINGNFGGIDLAFGAYISNELDSNFYYGLGIKYIYSGIDDVAGSALGIDAGIFYRLNERTNIGVSVLNVGTQIVKYNGQNVDLPTDIRISGNHRLRGLPILFNLAFHSLADDLAIGEKLSNIAVGLEIAFGQYVRGRVAFNNSVREETSIEFDPGLSGFTFGGGLIFDAAKLDYSLATYGTQTSQHRITISFDL
ncbi:PorV/PorQ family protein [Candidatus Kapabacteria bacterium]|nr:PorV/PorQ family protein [Candidatus Kapabacteria bacterium]